MGKLVKWGCVIGLTLGALIVVGIFILGKTVWKDVDQFVTHPKQEDIVKVDADQFSNDYFLDKETKKYADKIVEVKGIVQEVHTDFIALEGNPTIHVILQKNTHLSDVKHGDTIVIRGLNSGYIKETNYILLMKGLIIK
ncbi:hypothetical protein COC69_12375 [Bacillus cereus]|uniref:Uncharacterized protein n=1 Tax=Bacillus cereus TaxID=1396 RepID=A0A9X7CNV9_BACCE|nr:hypothetical protein [Bacillus cereus]PGS79403.1 hypothetical protein COC69_12375 [Bacillus cereus]